MSVLDPPRILLKEIQDGHAQENWYKLKQYLDCLPENVNQTINQTINVGGTTPWVTGSVTIGATSTVTVEQIPLVNFVCLDYTICIKNASGTLTKTLKLKARKDDTDMKDNIYAKEGDPIDIEISTAQISANCELQIVNNEAFSVDVSFARLAL